MTASFVNIITGSEREQLIREAHCLREYGYRSRVEEIEFQKKKLILFLDIKAHRDIFDKRFCAVLNMLPYSSLNMPSGYALLAELCAVIRGLPN